MLQRSSRALDRDGEDLLYTGSSPPMIGSTALFPKTSYERCSEWLKKAERLAKVPKMDGASGTPIAAASRRAESTSRQ